MGHPVSWFQIQGADAGALHAFYKKVFGWKTTAAPDGSGMMMVDKDPPDGIAGGIGASMDGNPNVSVYVTVKDLNAHLAKIEAAGGRRAMDPFELQAGWGKIAGFVDPAGNWIGLYQLGAAALAAQRATPQRKASKKKVAKKTGAPKKAATKTAAPKKAATKKAAPKKAATKKAAKKTAAPKKAATKTAAPKKAAKKKAAKKKAVKRTAKKR